MFENIEDSIERIREINETLKELSKKLEELKIEKETIQQNLRKEPPVYWSKTGSAIKMPEHDLFLNLEDTCERVGEENV